MAIYVYNGPLVIPKAGATEKSFTISVDGSAYKGGKRVVSWSNLRCSMSWVTNFVYEDYDYEEGGYYYYFTVTASRNTTKSERYAHLYLDYTLEDGTTGSGTIYMYQEAGGNITTPTQGPLIFYPDNSMQVLSPYIFYYGATEQSSILKPVVSTYFTAVATAGGVEIDGYGEEYDITAKYLNPFKEDRSGTIVFKYINPTTSVEEDYTLRLTQLGCQYPFGLVNSDGSEIGVVSNINPLKIIRDIPFSANTLVLECNVPYTSGVWEASVDDESIATLSYTTDYRDNEDIQYKRLYISFKENTDIYSRFTDLTISYTTTDGQALTDKVRLMQKETDGSNTQAQVVANVTQLKFKWDGTKELYDNVTVNWIGYFSKKTSLVNVDWITVEAGTIQNGSTSTNLKVSYPIIVKANNNGTARTGEINFIGTLQDGSTKTLTITVTQARKPENEEYEKPDIPVEGDEYCGPIWKDIEYNFGGVEQVDYAIYKTTKQRVVNTWVDVDTLLFKGRTCKRPQATSNTILINKICQSYMDSPTLSTDTLGSGNGYGIFKLKSDDGLTLYRTYRFVNDWSYSEDFKTGLLSHPILDDNKVAKNQLLPFTVFANAEQVEVPYGIRYKAGYTDDYGQPVEDWSTVEYVINGVQTIQFPYTGRTEGAVSYYIGNKDYDIVDDCNLKYVLYYVNPWGGYDWFPIRGKVTETDNITQYSYIQNYNNQTWGFGKKRYLSEINKRFTLNTQWLTEKESSKMWYLLQSNTVYLHNLVENKIEPVVITATSQEHKKYSLRSTRISYQIEVELSQTRERM